VLTIILTALLRLQWRQTRREERSLVLQMSDEQRSMVPLKAQPEGPVRIFHPAALLLAYVGQPHRTRSALLDEKCALAGLSK